MHHLSDDREAWAEVCAGLSLGRDGQLQDALRLFERAAAAAPGDPRAHAHKATCLAKLGRPQEAIEALDQALTALRRVESELRQRRGNLMTRVGRHAEAQHTLRRAVELEPANADAWYDLGVSLRESGMLADAAAAFRRAAELDPQGVDAWVNLASTYAAADRLADAEAALEQAAIRDPGDVDVLFQLGLCRTGLGHFDDALEAYDRALVLDAEDADLWNNRGVALHELGRAVQAGDSYAKALALNPELAEAAANRALLQEETTARSELTPLSGIGSTY